MSFGFFRSLFLFVIKVFSLLKLFNNNLGVTENLNLLFSFLSAIGLDISTIR